MGWAVNKAAPETEREAVLLRQIDWLRGMLAKSIRTYGRDGKWIRGHFITLFHSISRSHPKLKKFYK